MTNAAVGGGEEDLRALVINLFKAWNSGVSARILGHYAIDGDCVSFGITESACESGKDHRAQIEKTSENGSAQRSMSDDLDVHRHGSFGWATFTYTISLPSKVGEQRQFPVRCTMILEQRGNQWVVVHEHISVAIAAFTRSDPRQTPTASGDASSQNKGKQIAKLALLSAVVTHHSAMYEIDGEVQNISESSLSDIEVIVAWYTADNHFIRSDSALVTYNPILPRQISPYKVYSDINPSMATYKISFHEMAGASVLSEDRRSTPSTSVAQEPSQSPPSPAQGSVIEGRIFLVTGGGDIKPARFAKMEVISGEAKDVYDAVGKAEESISAMRDSPDELQRNLAESQCSIGLLTMWKQLLPNFNLAADEDGKFALESQPGTHTIMVFGKAGLNAAFWISTITVEPGKTATVKMGKPAIGCYDPQSTVSF